MTFPYDTHDLINRCNEDAPSVAAWSDDGLHFTIKDKTTFEKDFLTTKYTTFTRRLHNYGFRKINSELEASGKTLLKDEEHFKHISFKRGQRDLCDNVKRKAKPTLKTLAERFRRLTSKNRLLMDEHNRQADEIKRLSEEIEHLK
uniref:HSF-type DNA-binding domain-containing protein n=1 Tax=Ditylum brightwellii TaxID=49249 RepID=A0A7S4SY54_9STRA